MKAYEIQQGSTTLEGMRLIDRPEPKPAPGQILARMRAASLNFRDLMIVVGKYMGGPVAHDTVPLSDGAGEVVAIGDGVTRFEVGDRIAGTFFRGWSDGPPSGPHVALGNPVDGVLAEFVAFDQNDAVAIPEHLSFEEGATLPCAAVTAWHALIEVAELRPGQTVLILGTGGVSIFALQIARAAGARVVAISSSDDKLARVQKLGAFAGVNYRNTPEWDREIVKLTGGRGVDCVVEVGGAGTLARSFRSVGYGGKVALIGVLAGREGDTNPGALMTKGGSLHGIFVGNRAMLERVCAAFEANQLKPVIDRVFDFAQAADAFRHQQSGAHFGKVVIRIP